MRSAHLAVVILAVVLASATSVGAQGAKPLTKCAPDAVVSGTVCMDTYEASVWRVPNAADVNLALAKRIRAGVATLDDLAAGGAIQLGTGLDNYAPCAAAAACKNSRKRLPSNAEWQLAVTGTPDPGSDNGTTDCVTGPGSVLNVSGARSGCVSASGAFDMVGNAWERVAEWVPRSPQAIGGSWTAAISPTGDEQHFVAADTTGEPGAIFRGGSKLGGTPTGPMAIFAFREPTFGDFAIGFRCAR